MKKSVYSPLNKPTIVYVNYKKSISDIIKTENGTFALPTEAFVEDLLMLFFSKYPQVFKNAIPGTVRYSVNGQLSSFNQELSTGDTVTLELLSEKELQNELKMELSEHIKLKALPFSTEDFISEVFKNDTESFDEIMKKFADCYEEYFEHEEEFESYCNLLWRIWNAFPHAHLENKSPMEVLHKELVEQEQELFQNIKKIK